MGKGNDEPLKEQFQTIISDLSILTSKKMMLLTLSRYVPNKTILLQL